MNEDGIISQLCESDVEFRRYFNEHIKLEQDLEALYSLKFFPPEVEANIKQIKLQKLKGKDFMDKKIVFFKEHNEKQHETIVKE